MIQGWSNGTQRRNGLRGLTATARGVYQLRNKDVRLLHCSWHMRSPSPSGSAHRALPTNSSARPRALGVPPWIYPPPPQRECGLVCFFHVSGSRDSLLKTPTAQRPPSSLAPSGAPDQRSRSAGSSQRRPRNNAFLPTHRNGVAGGVRVAERAEPAGPVAAAPFSSQCPPARDVAPVKSWGPKCVATRRAAGRRRLLGPRGTSLLH